MGNTPRSSEFSDGQKILFRTFEEVDEEHPEDEGFVVPADFKVADHEQPSKLLYAIQDQSQSAHRTPFHDPQVHQPTPEDAPDDCGKKIYFTTREHRMVTFDIDRVEYYHVQKSEEDESCEHEEDLPRQEIEIIIDLAKSAARASPENAPTAESLVVETNLSSIKDNPFIRRDKRNPK